MAFQFYCPQGHMLQGHESQAGQQCQCPFCYTVFFIPYPQAPAMPGVGMPGAGMGMPGMHPGMDMGGFAPPTAAPVPDEQQSGEYETHVFPAADSGEFDVTGAPRPEEDENRIVHVICPEGHELPTPASMLGQDAMCPYCSSLFRLRYEDTKEAKAERQAERERREQRFGKKALNLAIVCAVMIVLAIVGMIVFSAMN